MTSCTKGCDESCNSTCGCGSTHHHCGCPCHVSPTLDEQHAHAERMASKWLGRYHELDALVRVPHGDVTPRDDRAAMRAVIEAATRWAKAKCSCDPDNFGRHDLDCDTAAADVGLLAALAAWEGSAGPVAVDDETRCAVCGWPLGVSLSNDCVPGNCSMRPRPRQLYAPARAAKEGK